MMNYQNEEAETMTDITMTLNNDVFVIPMDHMFLS